MNVPEVTQKILDATGWSQAKLAERLGVNQPDISRWLKGSQPRGQTMDALRGLAAQHGLFDLPSVVPIMGYVGAGGDVDPEFEQVPSDGLEQIELPAPIGFLVDPIGFLVRGESMMPRYNDGDIPVVEREQTWSFESMIGSEAVVLTDKRKRYLKKVMPGTKRNTFDLVSINAPTIESARLDWASPVRIIIPGFGLRRGPVQRPKSAARRGS